MAINKKTEAIPGSAVINPSTTRRNLGAVEITRNTRNIRKARRTVNDPPVGTSDTATTNVSKMFHQFVKNRKRYATSLRASSTTKITRHILSNDLIRPPKFDIIVSDVSKPKIIALNMITPIMKLRTSVLSMKFVSLVMVQLLILFDIICDVQLIRLNIFASPRFIEM
jgi:hypothetical protein